MDRTKRFYRIHQLIDERGAVPFAALLEDLEVSRATLKRDLEYLRDRLNAPIVWDRAVRGYRLGVSAPASGYIVRSQVPVRYELPGVWFNSSEVHALMAMQALLDQIEPHLLAPHIAPLKARLAALLGGEGFAQDEVMQRIRVLSAAQRHKSLKHFGVVANAVLKRQRLVIRHRNRQRDEVTEREVSPQRLVHYRDNWYLDAWCHLRRALRTFAVDAMESATQQETPAKKISNLALDAYLTTGYGIFGGAKVQWATLRFSAERARWVAAEAWHPQQKGAWLTDGRYELKLPYAQDPELIMDILKHGEHVEVVTPAGLRRKVAAALRAAAERYVEAPPDKRHLRSRKT